LELEEHVWELDGNILITTRKEEKRGEKLINIFHHNFVRRLLTWVCN
jgi:hypothetical protein